MRAGVATGRAEYAASLGQVLANLIGNALDAYEDARRPEPRILVGIARRDRQAELYTTKEIGPGTGLGLWISRNLIEQNFGGTLHAESEHGVGSTFIVTLPLAEDTAPAVAAPQPASPEARRVA